MAHAHALFHPLFFTARDGSVWFDGKALSEHRAIAVRERLNRVALDRDQPEIVADTFWVVCQQLRAAMTIARDQRRARRVVVPFSPQLKA